MQTLWFQHLPKAEQEEFKKMILGSQKVLDRLHEILYNKSIVESRTSEQDFDSPNWALKQAYAAGRRAQLGEVLTLIRLNQ